MAATNMMLSLLLCYLVRCCRLLLCSALLCPDGVLMLLGTLVRVCFCILMFWSLARIFSSNLNDCVLYLVVKVVRVLQEVVIDMYKICRM